MSSLFCDRVPITSVSTLYTSVLQLKDFRVDQWIKPCIVINIRELNRELCT